MSFFDYGELGRNHQGACSTEDGRDHDSTVFFCISRVRTIICIVILIEFDTIFA